jgi:hypothetical protein
MPTFDWQLIVALLAMASAACVLIRRAMKLFRAGKKAGSACGSCGSCAAGPIVADGTPMEFIPLEKLAPIDERAQE